MKSSSISPLNLTTLVALLLTMIPLIRLTDSLDAHMVGGWLILLCLILLGLSTRILELQKNTVWIFIGIGGYSVAQSLVGCMLNLEDLFLLLSGVLLLGIRGPSDLEAKRESVKMGIILGLSVQLLILLILLTKASLLHGYSHESTYAVQPQFAHRNIAIESCMLWFYWLLQQSEHKRQARWISVIAGCIAFVFQARSAMLMWAIMVAVHHNKIFTQKHFSTRIGVVGIAFFCTLQLFIVALPTEVYKPIFDRLPDNLKALDISYNLNEARSSSDRIELWKWTMENLNLWGHGLGQWRADAQGEVNERIGRCDLFVRHAHSDLLEYIYELGVLPVAILLGILLYNSRNHFKSVLVFSPLLLFSFPTERPEIMVVLAIIFFLDKRQLISSKKQELPIRQNLAILITIFTSMGIFSWGYSQHLLGRIFQNPEQVAKLKSLQQFTISLYPQDLLNNSLSLYQAQYLIALGEIDIAATILENHLNYHPNDLGVHKQLMNIKPMKDDLGLPCAR